MMSWRQCKVLVWRWCVVKGVLWTGSFGYDHYTSRVHLGCLWTDFLKGLDVESETKFFSIR